MIEPSLKLARGKGRDGVNSRDWQGRVVRCGQGKGLRAL